MHAIKGVPQPQRRYARPQAVIVRMQANVFRSNQAGRLNTFSSCVRLRRLLAANRTYGGYVEQGVYPQDWAGIIEEGDFGE